jgi:aminomethyltransferase
MSAFRRTPLHAFHAARGARFVDFSGWEMPVQYRSILDEHRAVRTAAGLFDVSHMGEVEVTGPAASAFLQHVLVNDVSRLEPGRVLYSPMCRPDGGTVDDLIVYCRGAHDFLLCVNAANTAKDLRWLKEHTDGFDCSVIDRSDDYALLALQGPAAAAILQPLTTTSLSGLRYYQCTPGAVAGVICLVARTGYTGEDGFELFCQPGDAFALALALLDAGSAHGLALAGLGARDSLRLEAGYPLYGHELSDTISPLVAGLGWTVKFDKGDFVGRTALLAQKQNGVAERIVFFRTGDRRIVRPGAKVFAGDETVGEVVSGTLSPTLGESIGSARLAAAAVAAQELTAEVRGARLPLTRVKPPFVPLPPKP